MNINNIFDKQTSILVLCSDTVKEPGVSSHIRVSKQTILLHFLFLHPCILYGFVLINRKYVYFVFAYPEQGCIGIIVTVSPHLFEYCD